MDVKKYLRSRNESGKIKIGVIEMYSNGNENAIRPFPMPSHLNDGLKNHADNVIKIIRSYVPNAEIHLVPNTTQGKNYLVEKNVVLVNLSLSSNHSSPTLKDLSDTAFLVVGAGNDGDKGESAYAKIEKACAVGAVDINLKPQFYSSHGDGAVKTCAITGLDIYTGKVINGTSFSAPVVVGLLAQWYCWYHRKFKSYPTINQTNKFVISNSQDIFEDDKDLRTGYGLFRLPKQFSEEVVKFEIGVKIGKLIRVTEGEDDVEKNVRLMFEPMISGGRTVIGASDLATMFGCGVVWNSAEKTSTYIK